MATMTILGWSLVGLLSGSIPYAVLVGRLAGAGDIRHFGDNNPGAANVGRALGWRWFTIAMLLDGFKGAIPVGLAYWLGGVSGPALIPVTLAPVLGHAYSPWLKLRGGKAVAVSFGIWAGLTLFVLPTVLGVLLSLATALLRGSGWAVLMAFGLLGVVIGIFFVPAHPEFPAIWLGNLLLLALKHQNDLREPPSLRPWVYKRLHPPS